MGDCASGDHGCLAGGETFRAKLEVKEEKDKSGRMSCRDTDTLTVMLKVE